MEYKNRSYPTTSIVTYSDFADLHENLMELRKALGEEKSGGGRQKLESDIFDIEEILDQSSLKIRRRSIVTLETYYSSGEFVVFQNNEYWPGSPNLILAYSKLGKNLLSLGLGGQLRINVAGREDTYTVMKIELPREYCPPRVAPHERDSGLPVFPDRGRVAEPSRIGDKGPFNNPTLFDLQRAVGFRKNETGNLFDDYAARSGQPYLLRRIPFTSIILKEIEKPEALILTVQEIDRYPVETQVSEIFVEADPIFLSVP